MIRFRFIFIIVISLFVLFGLFYMRRNMNRYHTVREFEVGARAIWVNDSSFVYREHRRFDRSTESACDLIIQQSYAPYTKTVLLTAQNYDDIRPLYYDDGGDILFYETQKLQEEYNHNIFVYQILSTHAFQQPIQPMVIYSAKNFLGSTRISRDGKKLIYCQREREDYSSIWLVDVQSKQEKKILTISGNDLIPVFSPTGKEIAFACLNLKNSHRYLGCFSLENLEMTILSEIPKKCDIMEILWSNDGNKIFYIEGQVSEVDFNRMIKKVNSFKPYIVKNGITLITRLYEININKKTRYKILETKKDRYCFGLSQSSDGKYLCCNVGTKFIVMEKKQQ
jgi:hypothetical protein